MRKTSKIFLKSHIEPCSDREQGRPRPIPMHGLVQVPQVVGLPEAPRHQQGADVPVRLLHQLALEPDHDLLRGRRDAPALEDRHPAGALLPAGPRLRGGQGQ